MPMSQSRRGGGGAGPPMPTVGLFVGLELRGRRFDYWAGLVRPGEPYLYVEELDGTGSARRPGDQASRDVGRPHVRRPVPPVEPGQRGARRAHRRPARRRCVGRTATPAPVTFDVEWYATGAADADRPRLPAGRRDRRRDRTDRRRAGAGWPGHRVHVWGVPYLPASLAMPNGDDLPGRPTVATTGGVCCRCSPAAGGWRVPLTHHDPRHPRRVRTAAPRPGLSRPCRRRPAWWWRTGRAASAATSSTSTPARSRCATARATGASSCSSPAASCSTGKPVTLVRPTAASPRRRQVARPVGR